MNNAVYYSLFQSSFATVSELLNEWQGDPMHMRLLDFSLSKLKDDFMADKAFPALVAPLLAYESFKTPDVAFSTLAAAHLLFYCFLDLTDDIEDHELEGGTWRDLGEPLAINAGTSLLFLSLLAIDKLGSCQVALETRHTLKSLFHEAGWWLTVGQHRDLYSRKESTLTPDYCLETMRLKTGTSVALYFEASACLAGAPHETQAHFKSLGSALGVLVQIRGDYQNIMDSQVSSDLKNKQITLPISILSTLVSSRDLETLTTCLQRADSDYSAHAIVRHLLKKYPVKSALNQYIVSYGHQIDKALESLEGQCNTESLVAFVSRIKKQL